MSVDSTDELGQILEKLLSTSGVELTEIDWERAAESIQAAKADLQSLIEDRVREARIDELERIRKGVSIVETEDYEWPFWCEQCHMMLVEEDDMCGCENAIRDRLAQLSNSKDNK